MAARCDHCSTADVPAVVPGHAWCSRPGHRLRTLVGPSVCRDACRWRSVDGMRVAITVGGGAVGAVPSVPDAVARAPRCRRDPATGRVSTRLVVAVMSGGPRSFAARERCRATWVADQRSIDPSQVLVMFFAGGAERTHWDPLGDGSEPDMLRLATPDDYDHLPAKVRALAAYLRDRVEFEHLVKCDDDTFLDLPKLVKMDFSGRDYTGRADHRGVAYGGAGYVLSRRAVGIVADHMRAATGLEDVEVGRCLATHGIKLVRCDRWYGHADPDHWPTPTNRQLTVHHVIQDETMGLVHQVARGRRSWPRHPVLTHRGCKGDFLASCPAIRALAPHGAHIRFQPPGHWRPSEAWDASAVESLRPLMMLQPYIRSIEFDASATPGDLRLDGWRERHPGAGLNIADVHLKIHGLSGHWSKHPWLEVDQPRAVARVVISRGPRWHNPAAEPMWRRAVQLYGREAVFVGRPAEHQVFVAEFGDVPYYPTADFLDIARVMAGAELVVCSQSAPHWVAEGLKRPKVLEVNLVFNNCHFERATATYVRSGFEALPSLPAREGVTATI
jgi:hypothetical protein